MLTPGKMWGDDVLVSDEGHAASLEGAASLEQVGAEIYEKVLAVAAGARSVSESLGHQEFILTYKAFEPIGPDCLPTRTRAGAPA